MCDCSLPDSHTTQHRTQDHFNNRSGIIKHVDCSSLGHIEDVYHKFISAYARATNTGCCRSCIKPSKEGFF